MGGVFCVVVVVCFFLFYMVVFAADRVFFLFCFLFCFLCVCVPEL